MVEMSSCLQKARKASATFRPACLVPSCHKYPKIEALGDNRCQPSTLWCKRTLLHAKRAAPQEEIDILPWDIGPPNLTQFGLHHVLFATIQVTMDLRRIQKRWIQKEMREKRESNRFCAPRIVHRRRCQGVSRNPTHLEC